MGPLLPFLRYSRAVLQIAVLGLVGVAASACSAPTPEVVVLMTDNAFNPEVISIQRSQKTILKLENKGTVDHNLSIPRQNITSPTVKPGQTATLELALPQGEFPILCSLPGHEGMTGKVSASRGK